MYHSFLIDAFLMACLVEFISFTFQYGNIFDFYRKYLIERFYKGDDIPLLEEDKLDAMESQITSKWYKVLGGCKYCFQVWLTLPIYLYADKYEFKFFLIFVSLIFVYLRLISYGSNFKR